MEEAELPAILIPSESTIPLVLVSGVLCSIHCVQRFRVRLSYCSQSKRVCHISSRNAQSQGTAWRSPCVQ